MACLKLHILLFYAELLSRMDDFAVEVLIIVVCCFPFSPALYAL